NWRHVNGCGVNGIRLVTTMLFTVSLWFNSGLFFSHKFTFPRDACNYRLLFRLALYVVCGSGSAYHHGDPNYSKLRLYCFTLLGMALYSTQFYRLCFTLCGKN